MRFQQIDPPRSFSIGTADLLLSHVANVVLEPGEVMTFVREGSGIEYDFVATDWGFYATASINGRLALAGFDVALVESAASRKQFVLSVERAHLPDFWRYLNEQGLRLVAWLGSSSKAGVEGLGHDGPPAGRS